MQVISLIEFVGWQRRLLCKKLFKIVALLVSSVYVIPLAISIGIDCILFCPNVALVNFQYILFLSQGYPFFMNFFIIYLLDWFPFRFGQSSGLLVIFNIDSWRSCHSDFMTGISISCNLGGYFLGFSPMSKLLMHWCIGIGSGDSQSILMYV